MIDYFLVLVKKCINNPIYGIMPVRSLFMLTTLYNLPLNQKGIIKDINTGETTKERLHSFGLIKDIEIVPLRAAPLGSPRIYLCLNAEIAIRNEDARLIVVERKG